MSSASTLAASPPANIVGSPARPDLIFGSTKIQPAHLERLAVVYVRQSTPQQVLENRESTALQYSLADRAVQLGWHPERVLVIDDDQGQSGRSAEGRLGFQRLLAEVSLDHVGLVLGIEMSRLARSCKDWYQLIELCALFGTLLADQDGLYDPTDFNDRLLLGLKGTMSEAELHIIHNRMDQGRRNKARRGELFSHMPIGYVILPSGEVILDPDEQAQTVVRLIFTKFAELGTIAGVVRYLTKHGILVGVRPISGPNRGRLEWRPPRRPTLRNMLRHPIYAGAYSYGRSVTDHRLKVPPCGKVPSRRVPREEWQAFHPDRLPAYITWEQHEDNLQQLERNSTRSVGVARGGPCLLTGLVYCGRCDRKMRAQSSKPNHPRYQCFIENGEFPPPICQGLKATVLDDLITRQVLRVLEPAALELSVKAAEDLQEERHRLHRHWKQRLERARYDTGRAERQYQEVEPENRLVARELESRWEKALCEERSIQEEYDRFQQEEPSELREDERQAILSLSEDIPALWKAPATTVADRQTIIRHLVDRVVVEIQGKTEFVDVTIHWAGGYVSHHEIARPVGRLEQMRDYDRFVQRMLELYEAGVSSPKIAAQLNQEGYRTPRTRGPFTDYQIRQLLQRRGLVRYHQDRKDKDQLLGPHEWWVTTLSEHLGIPASTIRSWRRRGCIEGRQLPGAKGAWILWADEEEVERLRQLHSCQRSWKHQAPAHLTTPRRKRDEEHNTGETIS